MRLTKLAAFLFFVAVAACADRSNSSGSGSPASGVGVASTPAATPGQTAAPPISLSPNPDTATFSALAPVSAKLSGGMRAFLEGKDVNGAFPDWSVEAKDAAKLRDDLARAGATSIDNLATEFELVFKKGDNVVYYLRTALHMGQTISLVDFEGREETAGVRSNALADYSGPGAPFKEAADSLVKVLKSGDCSKLPFLDAAGVAKIAPEGRLREQLEKSLSGAKANTGPACSKIASLDYSEVWLRLDDHSFAATGKDGITVGTIKADFKVEPGKISVRIRGFRALR